MHLSSPTPRNGREWKISHASPRREDVKIARSAEENANGMFSWRRIVVFADPSDATTRAIVSLYRTVITAAGVPSAAQLYVRRVGRCNFLYFSPEAAQLCAPIFEAFPAASIDRYLDLHGCTLITA